MPLRVTFSHADRLVMVVAKGDVFPTDIDGHVELVDRNDARV
jgi:hypothetical protein